MGRASKNTALDSKAKRLKLTIQREPHWSKIDDGKHLGYRKTGDAQGTWIVRICKREGGKQVRTFAPLGIADDGAAFGVNVLSYSDAIKAANAELTKNERADRAGVKNNSSYTVAEAVDDYIAEKERMKRKPQARARVIITSHIKPALGSIELSKLTHGKVKAWRDELAASAPRQRTGFVMQRVQVEKLVRGEKKLVWAQRATDVPLPQAFRDVDASDPDVQRQRQATANRILTVLKAALNFALEQRKVSSKDAWEGVKPFRKVDVPKVRFLTIDEVSTLIPACEPNFRELVKAALLTGCRFGELTAMHVSAFDAGEGRVYVADSKNGESRYVDLNGEGIALFGELTANRSAKETIFLRANGKAWKASEQKRPIDAACEVAKIDGVTFHILRHTYASHAVMNGMPIAVLSEHLGHKGTRITERHYAHLSQSYKQKLIRENAPSFGFEATKRGPVLVAKAS